MSIGEVLADARNRAGMTVTEVSHRTRIRETIITAIEGEDYSACGGDFYARGHIRSIAAAVGADPRPLIDEFDSARLGRRALADDATEPIMPIGLAERDRPDQPVTSIGLTRQRRLAGPAAPPGRYQQRRVTWAAALGVALVAGLGFAGYLLATQGGGSAPSARAHPASHHLGQATRAPSAPSAGGQGAQTAPATTTPAAAPPRTLTPVSAAAFGSAGNSGDNTGLASRAIDGNPTTAWHTDWYATARFGNLYPGTGLLVDMGRPVTITAAAITLGPAHGASFQLRVGTAPTVAGLRPVAHATNAGGVVDLRLTPPVHGRYVLVWFTSLPPVPAGTFQASVYNLRLEGRA